MYLQNTVEYNLQMKYSQTKATCLLCRSNMNGKLTFFRVILQNVTHVLIEFLKVPVPITGLLSLLNRCLKYQEVINTF